MASNEGIGIVFLVLLAFAGFVLCTPPRDGNYPNCFTSGISFESRPNQINDQATVICESRGGNPLSTLTWRRNGIVVAADYSTDAVAQKATSQITWALTWMDDAAMYECTETHPELPQPRTCALQDSIRVRYKPIITVDPQTITITTGQTAIFQCHAHGSPPLNSQQQWYFDGSTTVPDVQRYSVVQITGGGVLLQIQNIQESDYDVSINCIATNSKGTSFEPAHIITPPESTTVLPTTMAPKQQPTKKSGGGVIIVVVPTTQHDNTTNSFNGTSSASFRHVLNIAMMTSLLIVVIVTV